MNISEQLKNPLFKLGFDYGFTIKAVWDEWNEDDHPRDENGMFTEGAGANEVPADAPDWIKGNYKEMREKCRNVLELSYQRDRAKIKMRAREDEVGRHKSDQDPLYQKLEKEYKEANEEYSTALHEIIDDPANPDNPDKYERENTWAAIGHFSGEWEKENNSRFLHDAVEDRGIEKNEPEKLASPLSEKQLVDKLGGEDNTYGSCGSLAFAYIANKYNGMDVEDMRGGNSQLLFSDNNTLSKIAELTGGKTEIIKDGGSAVESARNLISRFEEGKEYFCGFGGHAAMCRVHEGQPQYLELQAPTDPKSPNYSPYWKNGWTPITGDALRGRFGCSDNVVYNSTTNTVIPAENLGSSQDFKDMIPYINSKKR